MFYCRLILTGSSLLFALGCVSKYAKLDPYNYNYSGDSVDFDDKKQIVIFEHRGESLRALLVIVDGKFFPGSALRFPEVTQINVKRFASLRSGSSELTRPQEGRSIELKGGITTSEQRGFFDGLYSNKTLKIEESLDYSDGRLQVDSIVDSSGIAVQTYGISKWTTDLNQNGNSETWLALPNSIQVWEGYKERHSLLLLDLRRY